MDEARCPVVTASAGYGDPYRELCGLPLVQDGACQTCGHPRNEHGQERHVGDNDSRRELCLMCDGYEEPGYPRGKAWHRYAPSPERCPVHGVPATKEGE